MQITPPVDSGISSGGPSGAAPTNLKNAIGASALSVIGDGNAKAELFLYQI